MFVVAYIPPTLKNPKITPKVRAGNVGIELTKMAEIKVLLIATTASAISFFYAFYKFL